ncbi:MAG: hypothetical protein ACYC2W_03495 [Desulfurivibrionaceae bacterium]
MPVPLIAAALASIAPALAKQGLDLLSGIFRGTVNKGTKEIAELIEEKTGIDINDAADNKLTVEQWAKLKDFEFQYQSKLLEWRQQADANDLERERLTNADRADARGLQKAALASDDIVAKRFIYFYASGLTLLTFVFIFYAAFIHDYKNGDQSARVIDTVLGFLLGVTLSAIIQYFFGSSIGSKSKEEKINAIGEASQAERNERQRGGQS